MPDRFSKPFRRKLRENQTRPLALVAISNRISRLRWNSEPTQNATRSGGPKPGSIPTAASQICRPPRR